MNTDFINVKLTLKHARLLKGLKMKDMAKELNVHVQTYSKMEKFPDTITIGEAKKISEILGMSYDQIFFNSNSTLGRSYSGAVTS
ncbi:helix-turn-helix transcriptional regulator [Bacillus safensis]|uniref:Transcriptional regulator n=1 Tax=Bacillus safensis TaxID=561879 RepID=A0A1L6ZF17_BACIA|nr:helix-turn-helix transcriptional regulator [Bacillus safensis]APT45094.1 transcriptional regulator [Bacillus safensis]MCY7566342.1 helix-turn-helix transcriptional regulator [Bacillus safensis]MCY7634027.1 helix-turn-helix transcriptional regulator [Bacillus safensis]MCY7650513.1 helix-turn-helix transcriptional regulator [Bacillus safensis]MEC3672824.1 helix-turn-helix transcriptional regulator [Bacillus safensis]